MDNYKLRLLSYAVIAYMLLAFGWWTILLNNKNEESYTARVEMLRIAYMVEGTYETESQFKQSARYQELRERYKRRQMMIFGESLVFVLSLFIGFWLINKGYRDVIQNSKSKTNFLLSISHELKSPVASIKLALETIMKRELSGPQIKKISDGALSETNRLKELISNLLLAAKLEYKYEITLEKVHVVDAITQIFQVEKRKYPDATLGYDIVEGAQYVETDRFALSTILHNLVENALKYSGEEKIVKVLLEPEGKNLRLKVSDRGQGIPDYEKAKIFDKFYRIGSEMSRETKGTGLGLFIISRMVKALNGNITVEDNDLKGTVFNILLPNHIYENA
ncbi:MAG: sensor histidine kinase [Saprospirales bacterium]|nr:MAG: sensor histidine kinase [Saprospirales bacterium]